MTATAVLKIRFFGAMAHTLIAAQYNRDETV